jgi:hypothetical protein
VRGLEKGYETNKEEKQHRRKEVGTVGIKGSNIKKGKGKIHDDFFFNLTNAR